jgi:negative regulator of sigma E activity
MVSDETFFAWLDGELSPEESARVEAEVAADPELSRLAEQHRAMQSRMKGAFDTIAETPVPHRLVDATRQSEARVIDFGAAKRARGHRPWGSLPQWAAMAATLAVGIFVGTQVPIPSHSPVQVQDGRIYAAAALNEALDTELAGAPSKSPVRIGLTFRDQAGGICRSFTQGQTSGLACRNGERWQLRGLFAAPEGQAGEYRMAAGMDPNLAALVDSSIAGEPFDAAQEKAAREKSWR